jgi:hypothetical protein
MYCMAKPNEDIRLRFGATGQPHGPSVPITKHIYTSASLMHDQTCGYAAEAASHGLISILEHSVAPIVFNGHT